MLQPCACLGSHSLGNLRTLLAIHAAFHNSGLTHACTAKTEHASSGKGHGGPRGVWRHSRAAWPAHRLRPTLGVSAWERDRERGVSFSSDSTRRRPTRKRKPASTMEQNPNVCSLRAGWAQWAHTVWFAQWISDQRCYRCDVLSPSRVSLRTGPKVTRTDSQTSFNQHVFLQLQYRERCFPKIQMLMSVIILLNN